MIHMRKRSLYIRLRNLGISLPPYGKTTFRELMSVCLREGVDPSHWHDLTIVEAQLPFGLNAVHDASSFHAVPGGRSGCPGTMHSMHVCHSQASSDV